MIHVVGPTCVVIHVHRPQVRPRSRGASTRSDTERDASRSNGTSGVLPSRAGPSASSADTALPSGAADPLGADIWRGAFPPLDGASAPSTSAQRRGSGGGGIIDLTGDDDESDGLEAALWTLEARGSDHGWDLLLPVSGDEEGAAAQPALGQRLAGAPRSSSGGGSRPAQPRSYVAGLLRSQAPSRVPRA